MVLYRHSDRRFPFLWDAADQPAARWNRAGEGPVQYLADTPYGAWAEFLRHEDITDPADLAGVSRALWAVDVELGAETLAVPAVDPAEATGGLSSYPDCQAEAERLAATGATGLKAVSAALLAGAAAGHHVLDGRLIDGPARDGWAYVLFGSRPDAVGWLVVATGSPPAEVLSRVRHL